MDVEEHLKLMQLTLRSPMLNHVLAFSKDIEDNFKPLIDWNEHKVYEFSFPNNKFKTYLFVNQDMVSMGMSRGSLSVIKSMQKAISDNNMKEFTESFNRPYTEIGVFRVFKDPAHIYLSEKDYYEQMKKDPKNPELALAFLEFTMNPKPFIAEPQNLFFTQQAFASLGIHLTIPVNLINQLMKIQANLFPDKFQEITIKNLNGMKNLCIDNQIYEKNKFRFNDLDNSIYWNPKQNALIFTDQNMGFVAFNSDNNWLITQFSQHYSNITHEKHYFKNQPTLSDLTLFIKDNKFEQVGSNFYSCFYDIETSICCLEEDYPPKVNKKMKP